MGTSAIVPTLFTRPLLLFCGMLAACSPDLSAGDKCDTQNPCSDGFVCSTSGRCVGVVGAGALLGRSGGSTDGGADPGVFGDGSADPGVFTDGGADPGIFADGGADPGVCVDGGAEPGSTFDSGGSFDAGVAPGSTVDSGGSFDAE